MNNYKVVAQGCCILAYPRASWLQTRLRIIDLCLLSALVFEMAAIEIEDFRKLRLGGVAKKLDPRCKSFILRKAPYRPFVGTEQELQICLKHSEAWRGLIAMSRLPG